MQTHGLQQWGKGYTGLKVKFPACPTCNIWDISLPILSLFFYWIELNVLKSGHLALSSTEQVDDIPHVLHLGQAGNFTFSLVLDQHPRT